MKLNLGCGFRKLDGWRNIDRMPRCLPDEIVDLEKFPWPWPDSTADEVRLIHVLEHIGDTSAVFLAFIKELWRVCAPRARINILVPHPRCDEFLWDATHVRPITPEGLRMFSQNRNQAMIERGNPETPLGIYLGVDFEIIEVDYIWKEPWRSLLRNGSMTNEQLNDILSKQLNVAKEISIEMRAIKSLA
jgi:hypothetical protein